MDEEKSQDAVIGIDRIDPVGGDVPVIIEDTTTAGDTGNADSAEPFSESVTLKTGNLLSKVFNLIAQFREKDYWELNTTEINSLNKTCPKILPAQIVKHAGIIGCVLSLIGIILKRIKLEREDKEVDETPQLITEDEYLKPETGLTGGRSG